MKLSVIIPVYRTEATLERCVESVVSQDVADMEVILVDDGSPDGCPQRCDAWAERDPRIKVIHKANGGLSDARNAGIEAAQGDYLTFVDSDDYLREQTYGPLMKLLADRPDIDILEYPVYVFYGSPKQHLLELPEKDYHDMEAYWLDGCAYQHTYACNKIFRAALFSKVKFPVGRVFEDAYTLPLLLEETQTVATTSEGLYYYCANADGITSNADGNALRMLLEPHVKAIGQSQRRDPAFYTYYMHVLNIQMDVFELTGEKPILPFIPTNPRSLNSLLKLKAITLNKLGIKRLCSLNKIIHKVWRNR